MKLNWNFLGGEGCKTKNLPWGEHGYFFELHISIKVTKMGSITGHSIHYNGVGALRGQRHIPGKY